MKGVKIPFFFMLFFTFIPLTGEDNSLYSEFSKEGHNLLYKNYKPSQEIVCARTLNSKVFETENGRLVFRIFLCPVHYIDENGMLEDMEDTCSSCFDWEIEESHSGFVDGLFEEKNVCGITTDYISVNDTYFYRGFVEFNTEIIPDTTTIDSVSLNLNCAQWPVYNEDHDIWSIENRPSISSAITIYNDAADGNCYVSNYTGDMGWNSWDLGEEACQDMEDLLQEDWFAIGISGWNSASAYHLLYQCGTGWIDVMEPIGVEEGNEKGASGQILLTNYPNPFRDRVEIRLMMEDERWKIGDISLRIYNVAGCLVKEFSLPTTYSLLPTVISWNGRNNTGEKVTSGVYFLRFNAGDYKKTNQLLMIK